MITEGQFVEYSWEDIVGLIYNDLGIDVPGETQDSSSTFYYLNNFNPPVFTKDMCMRVLRYNINPRMED